MSSPPTGSGLWWVERLDQVANLERPSVEFDTTISRMSPQAIARSRVLRERVAANVLDSWPVLVYESIADTHDGRIRLAAVFNDNPFASRDPLVNEALFDQGWRPGSEPRVFALDGPMPSPHRQPEPDLGHNDPKAGGCRELCLYYPWDPVERKWRPTLGILGLLDMARRHLEAEFLWRAGYGWPIKEAPHGRTSPAPREPYRLISPSDVFRDAA